MEERNTSDDFEIVRLILRGEWLAYFVTASHGEKRGIEMLQIYITHTHISSSLAQSVSHH